jgi:imidazolonepropionase
MGLSNEVGSISIGKQANLILTKNIPSYAFIPYSFGNPAIEKVYLKGVEIK